MEPTTAHCSALVLLLQAHAYTCELGCDPWDFAVEILCLRGAGATNSDLRWLLHKEFIRQAIEVAGGADGRRSFRPASGLRLSEKSCFVLTPAGVVFARGDPAGPVRTGPDQGPHPPTGFGATGSDPRPCWDKDRRALHYGGQLVKQFKVPAPNQEIILATFEEESWPVRIDDPLPCHPSIDPKRRLHDTINSLNRNQRFSVLRFLGDGSGEAVCWEPLAERDGDGREETAISG